ncbi:periplasmic heavy metal sensor [Zavarzinia sp. CC-PAN008]|uniref:periplasmic heavy metal sensor n=1 Tax=Zavarzinia sp. CC-PAN008 TaxID=3243332 RepID=UPI003F748CF1
MMSERRTIIGLSIALGISLIINVAVLGIASGRHWLRPPEPQKVRFLDRFPPDIQGVMRETFRPRRPELVQLRRGVVEARARVTAALKADPFDHAAFVQALEQAHAASDKVDRLYQANMSDLAPRLSPAQRSVFADHLPPP